MARKKLKGLQYFPVDVDIFEDKKMLLLLAEFGTKGESILFRLLCLIYRNGYYYKYTEDDNLLIANRVGNGVTSALVDEVVKGLVRRSFFDEGVFNQFGVLTSKGIQERFFEAIERRKEVIVDKEWLLVPLSSTKCNIKYRSDVQNVDIGTQSKVEKSKVEKSKVEDNDFGVIDVDEFFRRYSLPSNVGVVESIALILCQRNQISGKEEAVRRVYKLLDEFVVFRKAGDATKDTYSNFVFHFRNWVTKKPYQKPQIEITQQTNLKRL